MSQEEIIHSLTGNMKVVDFDRGRYAEYVKASRLFSREIQVAPGEHALLVNGRVGPCPLL